MKIFRLQNNLEEYQQVFEIASWMPYDWCRVVGRLLGDRNDDLTFGGSCGDQAMFTIRNLPQGCAQLTWDQNRAHFGVLINDRHHFDPVCYQTGINPYYTSLTGRKKEYQGLINGGRLVVSRSVNNFNVQVDYPANDFVMSVVHEDVDDARQKALEKYEFFIKRKPYIAFPSLDGCEVKVDYDTKKQDLLVDTRFDEGVPERTKEYRLAEMEQSYGFRSEDLLRYFTESWRRVSRLVNVD